MTMTTAPMEVYCVKTTQLSTGTRIEAFTTKALLFADKNRAIQYAKKAVEEYKHRFDDESDEDEEEDDNEEQKINEGEEEYEEHAENPSVSINPFYKGTAYFYTSGKPSSGYEDWPDFQVQVKKQKMDLNSGFKIEFSA